MNILKTIKLELLNDGELKQSVGVVTSEEDEFVRTIENEEQLDKLTRDIRHQGLPVQIITLVSATQKCSASGDTIQCGILGKILACAYEVSCKPNFASECTKSKFTITGCEIIIFS